MKYRKAVIYLADDDEDDRYFARQSLLAVYPFAIVIEAQDGSELLGLLDTWSQQLAPQPVHLILLDMNMPKLNGLETLIAIKANPSLRHIPTVILSTSAETTQQDTAYQSGASGYLKKPVSYLHLDNLMRSVSEYLIGGSTD